MYNLLKEFKLETCKGEGSLKIMTKISEEPEIRKYINYIVCVKLYKTIFIIFITRGVNLEMFMTVEIFILHIDYEEISPTYSSVIFTTHYQPVFTVISSSIFMSVFSGLLLENN